MTSGARATLGGAASLRGSWPQLCRCATWPVLVAAACGPLAVAGCVAVAQLSWVIGLTVGAAGAVVSGAVGLLVARHHPRGRGRTSRLAGCLLAACVLAAWWAQAAILVVPLVAPWWLLPAGLAGVAGVTIVLARTRCRLRESRDAWRIAAAFVVEPRRYQLAVLHGTSAEELCRMWDETTHGMGRVVRPDVLSEYVELRGLLLAELERRNPAAFARWLDHADATHIRELLARRAG